MTIENSYSPEERYLDLLAKKVTEGLSPAEQNELDQMDWEKYSLDLDAETERFETAAAAFDQAFGAEDDPQAFEIPSTLRDKLLVSAGEYFAATEAEPPPIERVIVRKSALAPPSWRETLSVLAAAACLFLLAGSVSGLFDPFSKPAANPSAALEEMKAANPGDLVKVAWTNIQDPNVKGEVFWSDEQQRGFMVFDGLAVNDPSKEQYQLWIFDTDVGQEVPIDGGVFDIETTGKVVVPITAQHPVSKAVMFAVTIEKPGGVQKSDRSRLPVLAKVDN